MPITPADVKKDMATASTTNAQSSCAGVADEASTRRKELLHRLADLKHQISKKGPSAVCKMNPLLTLAAERRTVELSLQSIQNGTVVNGSTTINGAGPAIGSAGNVHFAKKAP